MAIRTGTVALVGRPNAGKSTLLNALVGVDIAATSDKPQTTRTSVRGIVTSPTMQAQIVDTPGLHLPRSELNRRMVAAAEKALGEVDLACWLVDATRPVDEELISRFEGKKVVIALNKVDAVQPKTRLLPLMAAYAKVAPPIPISARTGDGLLELLAAWEGQLPEGEALFPEDQATNAPERAIVAELIREQLVRQLEEELPYVTAVEIEQFDESQRTSGKVTIKARVVVEKPSQKAIVIGAKGATVKRVRQKAEVSVRKLLGCKAKIELFVAVEPDWTHSPRLLREFGYPGE